MKRLAFYKKENHWYANVPLIPEANCMMVSGANQLLNILAPEDKVISLNFKLKYDSNKFCINLVKIDSSLFKGAYYKVKYGEFTNINGPEMIWLCPVTLFALGHYPKNISINITKQDFI